MQISPQRKFWSLWNFKAHKVVKHHWKKFHKDPCTHVHTRGINVRAHVLSRAYASMPVVRACVHRSLSVVVNFTTLWASRDPITFDIWKISPSCTLYSLYSSSSIELKLFFNHYESPFIKTAITTANILMIFFYPQSRQYVSFGPWPKLNKNVSPQNKICLIQNKNSNIKLF